MFGKKKSTDSYSMSKSSKPALATDRRELYTGPGGSAAAPSPDLVAAMLMNQADDDKPPRRWGRWLLLGLVGASAFVAWSNVKHDGRSAYRWQLMKTHASQGGMLAAVKGLPDLLMPRGAAATLEGLKQSAGEVQKNASQALGKASIPGAPTDMLKNPMTEARKVVEMQNQRFTTQDPDGGALPEEHRQAMQVQLAKRQAGLGGAAPTSNQAEIAKVLQGHSGSAAPAAAAKPSTPQGPFPYGFKTGPVAEPEPTPVRAIASGSLSRASSAGAASAMAQ